MQLAGHGGAADHQRQGQHHFDLVLLDAFDHSIDQIADQTAKHHAANGFMGKQHRGGAQARGFAQLHNAQQYGEHHNGGAVIEQRLTDNRGFQRFGCVGGTQHAKHGDRISGRNQGAEQQAIQEADMPSKQAKDPVRQAADHGGGNQHTDGGQQADGPAVAAYVVEVYVQGAGKQQEGKHPVHQQIAEIDLADQLLHAIFETGIANKAQALQQQGKHEGGDHHTNGWRQADKTEVHVCQQ